MKSSKSRVSLKQDMARVFELTQVGLSILPKLLPQAIQIAILDRLLHRDVSNPSHLTNLHPFYDIPYEQTVPSEKDSRSGFKSLFSLSQDKILLPKDPSVHKPITMKSVMDSKLRWITLGGQYDWTNKVYPAERPPTFPPDLASLLGSLFPEMRAEAAIVNLYSPGDTLSMHRDVSEECDRGLVSISIGCDAIFMVGNEDGSEVLSIRLKSGDAVFMDGSSRFAWHGVPKVLKGTCPGWLQDWPASSTQSNLQYESWRGWMLNKRINLNVRQMTE